MSLRYQCIMLETPNVSGLAELETEVTRLVSEATERLQKENPDTGINVLPQLIQTGNQWVYDICLHVYME